MDWRNIIDTLYLWYNEFIEWYSVQPIYGQVLAIVGIIALLSLAIVAIYYVIKGIAYLIYYILKGIYYLLKGIGLGFSKLCEGFYNLISGKNKTKKPTENNNLLAGDQINRFNNCILYCTECGKRFSENMMNKILSIGNVFCVNCGKELNLIDFQNHLTLTH
ncbi:MAG: hypothetical protein ACFFBC_04675 [Promethearchaeota archaeon]